MRAQRNSRHLYGLPHDGIPARKGVLSSYSVGTRSHIPFTIKWVDDIADAGGSLYCFHLEATGNIQLHVSGV